MTDSDKLFNSYNRHYVAGAESHFIDPALAKAMHRDRLPRWLMTMPRDLRILDAGCANGYQLQVLRHSGFENLIGVDISEEMASLARAQLGETVRIVTSPIDVFLKNSEDSFDVILLHHVIEHVSRDNALELLRLLFNRLAPNGYLSIRTPNANILAAGYHCHGDFTHVVSFNERSLLQVLESVGFSPHQVSVVVKPPKLFFSLRQPIAMLLRLLNRFRWFLNKLVHIFVYLLGDIRPIPRSFDWELDIVARK